MQVDAFAVGVRNLHDLLAKNFRIKAKNVIIFQASITYFICHVRILKHSQYASGIEENYTYIYKTLDNLYGKQ